MRNKVLWLADLLGGGFRQAISSPDGVPEITPPPSHIGPKRHALPDADRGLLERWARSRSAPFKLVLRSRIVLMVHSGVSMAATAKALSTTPRTVRLWCRRYELEGAESLRHEAPGRGRRAGLSAETVERIVALTLSPLDGKRPTARAVATASGTSPASVCRVWAARGIRPGGRQARPTPRCETAAEDDGRQAVAGRLLPGL